MKTNGLVYQLVLFVHQTAIDEGDFASFYLAIGFVNMPEQVYRGLKGSNFFQKVFIAIVFLGYNLVENAKGRRMGHEDIGVFRYFLPVPADVGAAVPVESPVVVKRRNGRTPDPDAFNGGTAIVEVSNAFRNQGGQLSCRYLLQAKIVVAANKNFVAERLKAKPKQEVQQLGAQATHGDIAGMQQHIAGWQTKGMVAAVGIGDGNKLHGHGVKKSPFAVKTGRGKYLPKTAILFFLHGTRGKWAHQ